jgi:hypothetical protein
MVEVLLAVVVEAEAGHRVALVQHERAVRVGEKLVHAW